MKLKPMHRIALTAFLLSTVTACCQTSRVGKEQIVAVLKASLPATPFPRLHLAAEEVDLPGEISVRGDAVLRLTQLEVEPNSHVLYARFQCEGAHCMPFYITVRNVALPNDLSRRPTFWAARLEPNSPVARGSAPVLRQGEKALLSFQKQGLRISVPVICLQAGALGQVIRTRIIGTNRTTTAHVIGPGRVSMPRASGERP